HAEHHRVGLLEPRPLVPNLSRFDGAARGIVLGVEVENHVLSTEVGALHALPRVRDRLELRRLTPLRHQPGRPRSRAPPATDGGLRSLTRQGGGQAQGPSAERAERPPRIARTTWTRVWPHSSMLARRPSHGSRKETTPSAHRQGAGRRGTFVL